MNPDDMLQGGLMDDFDGTITKARFVPWDYNGSIDHHILAVAVEITPDEGQGDPFTQHYSAGDLEHFAPSVDGVDPVDLESWDPKKDAIDAVEGEYAVRTGRKEQMNNNTNWASFISAGLDAGFDKAALSASVACFEDTHGHFNRVPQKKRSGLVTQAAADGQKARSNDILVLTEISEAAKGAKSAKGKPNGAAGRPAAASPKVGAKAAPAAAAAGGDLDETLFALIAAAMTEAEGELPKAKLGAIALKGLTGKEKALGLKRVQDPEFLNSGGEDGTQWMYDEENATLLAAE
jgi:hypothetical protein